MIFRMCNIPLPPEKFDGQMQRIYCITKKNGLATKSTDSLIRKHKKRIALENITSLSSIQDQQQRATAAYKILKCFERANVCVAAKNTTKLAQFLVSTKDTIPNPHKPGVYCATCSVCGVVYIGQTRREMRERANEHLSFLLLLLLFFIAFRLFVDYTIVYSAGKLRKPQY